MRYILSLFLVATAFVACYAKDIYLHFRPVQVEKRVYMTLRSNKPFSFDQEKVFGGKRNLAISQYVPLYIYLPDRVIAAKQKMDSLIKQITTLQGRKPLDSLALSNYIRSEFSIDISADTALQLLGYSNLKNLLEAIWTIEESAQQSKIVEDMRPVRGKKAVEVRYPDPVGTVAYSADEFVTLEKARASLQEKASQLFWQVDKAVLDPALRVAAAMLSPNLRYDQRENDRRIEQITRRYPSRIVPYDTGDVLVPFGKVLTEEDTLLVEAARMEEQKDLYGRAPWVLGIIVFSVILFNVFLSKAVVPQNRNGHPYSLLLFLLILTLLLLKACLLFSSVAIYALPIGLLPLVLILLYQEPIPIACTALLAALLTALFTGLTPDILVFFIFGGLATILFCPKVKKWYHVLIPSLIVGLFNAIMVACFLMDWNLVASLLAGTESLGWGLLARLLNRALLIRMGWGMAGGFVAGPLALVLLPPVELTWGTVSAFKLNTYTDLQHPLLRDLLIKAPGTYQHTMTVAYLAQAVGEALGANTRLLRAGAYFHDVGKTVEPRYFIENQAGGSNPHDGLDPQKSCEVIINHVRLGKEIAAKAGLPDEIADFIPQHHGTLLVEYFHDKACAGRGKEGIDEAEFRYPGPKPQSVEAAILMISDAVEAACRTLQEPTHEKIKSVVGFIIGKRLSDGQLDECDLSTRDIGKIIEILTTSLEAAHHSRVEYPWQREEREGA